MLNFEDRRFKAFRAQWFCSLPLQAGFNTASSQTSQGRAVWVENKKMWDLRIEPFCLRSSSQIIVHSRFGVGGKIIVISVRWSTKSFFLELVVLVQILMGETPSRSFSAGVFSAVLAGILGGLVMVRIFFGQFSIFTFITCTWLNLKEERFLVFCSPSVHIWE